MIKQHIIRLDRGEIGLDGIFRATGRAARIGTYTYLDGVDLKSEDELLKSLPQYDRVPITIDHAGGFVDAQNKDELVKGFITNPRYEKGWVIVDVAIHVKDAIELITTTHQYFSMGYDADLIESAGTWCDDLGLIGQSGLCYPYDNLQTNIRINHITITNAPRAGKGAKVMNSIKEDLAVTNHKISNVHKEKHAMVEILHNGLKYNIEGNDAANVAKLFNQLLKQVEAAESTDNLTSELDSSKAKVDSLEAKIVALESDLESAKNNSQKFNSESFNSQVSAECEARLAAFEVAQKVNRQDSFDPSKTVNDIKKEALAIAYPHSAKKLDSASDSYIEALWDELVYRQSQESKDEVKEVKEKIQKNNSLNNGGSGLSAAQKAYMAKRVNRQHKPQAIN